MANGLWDPVLSLSASAASAASAANHNSRNYNNENADEFADSLAETTPLTNASRAKVNTSDVKVINSLIEDLSRQSSHVSI